VRLMQLPVLIFHRPSGNNLLTFTPRKSGNDG
jgi:hypothetical protein